MTGNPPTIRAIPEEYKGIEFRSRLEANVARLLDAVGAAWSYEQEGYDLDGEWYLPDFWLPNAKQFVEVKGVAGDPSISKCRKLAQAVRGKRDDPCSPAAVVVLSQPFVRACVGISNYVEGYGFNGAATIDAMLCLCGACKAEFFATNNGAHDCSACGTYQNSLPYGDLRPLTVSVKHARGRTSYGLVEWPGRG